MYTFVKVLEIIGFLFTVILCAVGLSQGDTGMAISVLFVFSLAIKGARVTVNEIFKLKPKKG